MRNMRAAMREYEGASEASEERAKRMLDFIHMHYAEPIQLSDIAAAANVGERECLRAFKKTLGVTPTAYLLRYRSSMSAQMLLDTDKSIAEICFEVGFNSQSHYGQDVYKRQAMRNLKLTCSDPFELIAWRDIYACLENCCDACEKVADAVEEVVMKNT